MEAICCSALGQGNWWAIQLAKAANELTLDECFHVDNWLAAAQLGVDRRRDEQGHAHQRAWLDVDLAVREACIPPVHAVN